MFRKSESILNGGCGAFGFEVRASQVPDDPRFYSSFPLHPPETLFGELLFCFVKEIRWECSGIRGSQHWGARKEGLTLRKDVFLPCKHLLSAFYEMLPSKNAVLTENSDKAPSKDHSKKHLLLTSLLRTLLRKVLLHDPVGVCPEM